ncbi:MAG: ABC transporter ATP-binding protein [Desulfobulbaceae bacterium]|nr:ABC transporter ATP-binding protein [Desulfobulbaceae bacterium]
MKLFPTLSQLLKARATIRLLGPYIRTYRRLLIWGIAALLAVDLLQLFIPRVIKQAVDDLQRGLASPTSLLKQGGLILLYALGIALCRFAWRYLVLGFSRLLERDLRNRLLDRLIRLDRPFFNRHTAGEIMALSGNDLANVQMACGIGLVSFIDAFIMTGAALGFMAYIHPGLTILALAPMPVLAILTGLLSALLHRRYKLVQEQFSTLTEFARSTLAAIRLIKAYTQEERQSQRFDRLGREYVRNNIRLALVQGVLTPFSTLIANISLLLVLFFGGRLTIAGTISLGDFAAFLTYLALMTWPMMAMGWVANLFQRGVTSLHRIRLVLEEEPLLHEPENPAATPPGASLAVRDLSFRYAGQSGATLRNLNLEIPPGLLGIVGRTGSGKSALCQLLARLYPVADGQLFLAGVDYNRLPLAAVRSKIAYVPQEAILFADTIRANIAFGRPEASDAEIEKAARAAAIHEEIIAFQDGYQSRVGEKGLLLSGGQRQRLALARALLLDRPIVIIDDGLAAVDTDTEHRIIENFRTWLPGRTCILVSHRVAPLLGAAQIIVLKQGAVVARGSHQELLTRSDFYHTIYHHQMTAGEAAA